jgi:hypothetical protein
MNNVEFNELLWLGFAVVALLGKVVYEYVVTRAETRREAAQQPPVAVQDPAPPFVRHSR